MSGTDQGDAGGRQGGIRRGGEGAEEVLCELNSRTGCMADVLVLDYLAAQATETHPGDPARHWSSLSSGLLLYPHSSGA